QSRRRCRAVAVAAPRPAPRAAPLSHRRAPSSHASRRRCGAARRLVTSRRVPAASCPARCRAAVASPHRPLFLPLSHPIKPPTHLFSPIPIPLHLLPFRRAAAVVPPRRRSRAAAVVPPRRRFRAAAPPFPCPRAAVLVPPCAVVAAAVVAAAAVGEP
ncbi:Os08g0207951, partial [Oryza sativa Japonica Group]